jgi:hypothetical protein
MKFWWCKPQARIGGRPPIASVSTGRKRRSAGAFLNLGISGAALIFHVDNLAKNSGWLSAVSL